MPNFSNSEGAHFSGTPEGSRAATRVSACVYFIHSFIPSFNTRGPCGPPCALVSPCPSPGNQAKTWRLPLMGELRWSKLS